AANGITPESIKRSIHDILGSVYERDHVLIATGAGAGGEFDDAATIGHNFEAVIAGLDERMRQAAAELDFEAAARLRDQITRLRSAELAVIDDPTARIPSPVAGEDRRAEGGGVRGRDWAPRKPTLDEMGPGPAKESRPYRGPRSTTGRPGMRGGWRPRGR